ncbi:hypothetical protein DFH09DRAFT_1121380 [Mycena vulgaris]|nr:hypothetical protein DFH09DRAFT_1121380 [Mycena vulgaris]
MHPALELHNLSRLPFRYRRLATSAANGCPRALHQLQEAVRTMPVSQGTLVVPAFFVHLDLKKLHDIDADIDSCSAVLGISNAYAAICGLAVLDLSPELLQHCWAPVWAWAQFLTQNAHALAPRVPVHEVFIMTLSMLGTFDHQDPHTVKLLEDLSEFRSFVARCWSGIVQMDDSQRKFRNVAMQDIWYFIRNGMDVSDTSHLADLIQGSGGTLADLADLVVKFVGLLSVEDGDQFFSSLKYGLAFMTRAEMADGNFRAEMLSAGVVHTLTKVACGFCESTNLDGHVDVDDALESSFEMLRSMLASDPGYIWINEALAAGLLRAIVVFASKPGHVSAEMLESILWTILARHAVYYSVLVCIELALHELADLVAAKSFQTSKLYPVWMRLIRLVELRLEQIRFYESENYTSMKACDNMSCSVIAPKRNFRSCGACHGVFYCAEQCQSADWRDGGHRELCKYIRTHSLRDPDPVNTRDRSFFRAILHRDYENNRQTVLLRQLLFMRENPEAVFATVFHYGNGSCRIECIPIEDADTVAQDLGPQWVDCVARALASGGISLHLMVVGEGLGNRCRIVPLRFDSTSQKLDLHEELLKLVAEIPPGTTEAEIEDTFPGVLAKINALVEKKRGAEIH